MWVNETLTLELIFVTLSENSSFTKNEIYVFKNAPVSCTNTHHVTNLVNHGDVKNTKSWNLENRTKRL